MPFDEAVRVEHHVEPERLDAVDKLLMVLIKPQQPLGREPT